MVRLYRGKARNAGGVYPAKNVLLGLLVARLFGRGRLVSAKFAAHLLV